MTTEKLSAMIEDVVAQARNGGLDDETIIDTLIEAVQTLQEGLT